MLLRFPLVIVALLGELSLVVLAARVESKGAAAITPIDHVLRVHGHALIVLLQVLICLLLTGDAQDQRPLFVLHWVEAWWAQSVVSTRRRWRRWGWRGAYVYTYAYVGTGPGASEQAHRQTGRRAGATETEGSERGG